MKTGGTALPEATTKGREGGTGVMAGGHGAQRHGRQRREGPRAPPAEAGEAARK